MASAHHAIVEVSQDIPNKPAAGISYFTPAQDPPAGTASDPQPDGSHPIKLFQPLQIRGVKLQNRIMLSPLCQYSAQDGHPTAWHLAHLGGIIKRGTGLAMAEACAVVPEGRITPEDVGLWKDSQIDAWKPVVEFAHSQGQLIGIQLAHAGRKASTVAPWLSRAHLATKAVNGWPDDVYAPSPVAYDENHAVPKAMSLQDIQAYKEAFAAAVRRAIAAGFDVIEIHNAHGYLLHEFLSPVSNHRTDDYGGSFENRTRLTLEVVDICRREMPAEMPLFLRISATDWLEEDSNFTESWTVADTAKLAPLLAEKGVDLLDVSSGGNHPAQHIKGGPAYQAPFAYAVKKVVGDKLLVGSVGSIETGTLAQQLLEGEGEEKPPLDLIIVGRMFQKNPAIVWTWAEELGVEINVANQIRWGFGGRVGFRKN